MITTKVKVGPALKEILELCFRATTAVLLVGKTGLGKSELIKEFAKDLGVQCLVLDLTMMEPVDLIGLPEKCGNTVRYLHPEHLPQSGQGILFLDEINRASDQMLNASLQLLSARRLNSYTLPEGWMIAAAVNPDDDQNYNTNKLDDAMMARFVRIEVESCVESWIQYAERSGHHDAVVKFVRATPRIFDGRMSNPRAWTKISTLVQHWEFGGISNDALQAVLQGCVGNELAVAFIRTLRDPASSKVPTPDTIVKHYAKLRRVIRGWHDNGDTARQDSACRQMILYLQKPTVEAAIRKSKQQISNLLKFRSDLIADLRVKFDEHAPWLMKEVNSNG